MAGKIDCNNTSRVIHGAVTSIYFRAAAGGPLSAANSPMFRPASLLALISID